MTTQNQTITKIAIFQKKEVRKILHKNEWWFSVIDVIEVLTDTARSRKYWSDLKRKLIKEGYSEVSEKIGQLKMTSPDGKKRETDCANTETIFRIIQAIPSPKAEPFKRWLARVGFERIEEIENPELATKRTRALYKAKGYSDTWIEKRMQEIEIETDTIPTELKKILVDKINQSLWWHVTPSDPDAYKKRGKFLASTYSQAAFYGKPNIKPERIKISHPLCSDSEKEILKVLFPETHQRMLLFITSANESDYYERRINLDEKMHEQAKKLGYDSIVLLGSTAINELVKNRKPRSIELNLCV